MRSEAQPEYLGVCVNCHCEVYRMPDGELVSEATDCNCEIEEEPCHIKKD